MKRALPLALLTLVALTGCSAIKLSYNRVDWIAAWQLGRLVDLDPPQKELFDERFRDLWEWHRGTQLELYVGDLRELAGRVERPLTPAQVEAYLGRSRDHLGRLLQHLVPDTAQVLKSFEPEQVAELTDSLAERRRQRAEESEGLTQAELQEQAQDQMVRNLKRWTGPLDREQKERVRQWAASRVYAGTIWQQYQEAWAGAFTEVLAHRQEPDFAARLSALFDNARVPYRDEMAKVQEHNRRTWIRLMADLSATLTPEQRRHLQEQLRTLAADLEELARQTQQAALPRIIG